MRLNIMEGQNLINFQDTRGGDGCNQGVLRGGDGGVELN